MLICLGLHVAASLAYFTFWLAREKCQAFCRLVVVLFLPVLGFIYFIFLHFYDSAGNIAEVVESYADDTCDVPESIKAPDFKKEVDILPLEEVLLLPDFRLKRKMFFNALRDDSEIHMPALKMALNDIDSETSHYAAAAVFEYSRRQYLSLQEFNGKFRDGFTDTNMLAEYADLLKACLEKGVADKRSHAGLSQTYKIILERLIEVKKEEKYFADRINYDLEAGEYTSARRYCERYAQAYVGSEGPCHMYLKLFYLLGDSEGFQNMLSFAGKAFAWSRAADNVGFWLEGSRI